MLVAGTSSDARTSLVTTGICRYLARQGLSVTPFKSQNMSNNSMVCADGSEAGRAQYVQAQAVALTDGSWDGHPVRGYEIHHGIVTVDRGSEQFLDGCHAGSVWCTTWHGTFESDEFRRAFPARTAATAGVEFDETPPAGYLGFAERRESMIDRLADMIERHLDIEALLKLLR